jgi:hypothetical protein
MRFFNTEGPNRSEDHYTLPPLGRWDLELVLELIEQKKYFLLHAPRQAGKTTCLLAVTAYLNAAGHYRALYANIEPAQACREDLASGMAVIVGLGHNFGHRSTCRVGIQSLYCHGGTRRP